MSAMSAAMPLRDPRTIPFHQMIGTLIRNPLATLEDVGVRSSGEIIRLNLGGFRPYLITRPEHIERVLKDNAANYRREGMMWTPLTRLTGETGGEGPEWVMYRDVYSSLLSGPKITKITGGMAQAINEAVDELEPCAREGRPIDVHEEVTRIVYRAISRIFVGDRISLEEIDKLGRAVVTATTSSFRARMLMPFVPNAIPLPGDRTFHRAIREMDELVFPIVRETRRLGADGDDIVSMLVRARMPDGRTITDQEVRDGIVGLFVAATETTVTALTFLWQVLEDHPRVAARLYDEIDRVVGDGRPTAAHVPKLTYTKQVLMELLRKYPVAWVTPRTVAADDVIDGVRVKSGATVVISPYLTHRVPDVWPNPQVFDPERFAPHQDRHRFAFLAFGAGPHHCVGRLVFTVEAQLVVASLLSRYRPDVSRSKGPDPQAGLTLKPREKVEMVLRPRSGAVHG